MDEKDKIERLGTSKKFEAEADSVDVKGNDGGKIGVMSQFEFYPNKEFNTLPKEKQLSVAADELNKVLYRHCDTIGWYPDRSPEILKNDKGVFRITAYLKRGNSARAKMVSELEVAGSLGINNK